MGKHKNYPFVRSASHANVQPLIISLSYFHVRVMLAGFSEEYTYWLIFFEHEYIRNTLDVIRLT